MRLVVAGKRVRAPGFRGSRHRGMTIGPGDPRGPESAGRMSVGKGVVAERHAQDGIVEVWGPARLRHLVQLFVPGGKSGREGKGQPHKG